MLIILKLLILCVCKGVGVLLDTKAEFELLITRFISVGASKLSLKENNEVILSDVHFSVFLLCQVY